MPLGHDFVDDALGLFQPKNSFWDVLGNIGRSMIPFGSLIDSGISLISGISNNIYARKLQKTMFERDDTAMDRLMAQYERNGVNPLLAVPGVSPGNTKAFEPGQIQTNFAQIENQKLAREQFEKNNELLDKQIEQLTQTMRLNKQTNDMDLALKQAELNGYIDYSNKHQLSNRFGAVKPAETKSDIQKVVEWFWNFISGNGSSKLPDLPKSSEPSEHKSGKVPETQEEKNKKYTAKERYNGLLHALEKRTVEGSGFPVYDKDNNKTYINWRENRKDGVIEVTLGRGEWVPLHSDTELYSWLYDNGYHVQY